MARKTRSDLGLYRETKGREYEKGLDFPSV